jgi:D-alanine-D-alanine ligase
MLLKTYFIIQPLIESDIEVSCGCLEKKNGEVVKLPAIEIIPQSSTFFDYKAKYVKGGSKEITPPEHISEDMADRISQLAVDIHRVLGCSVYSRSDFLIKGNDIFYLETNTLPGMTNTSLLPQEAEAGGISFSKLIDFLVENS